MRGTDRSLPEDPFPRLDARRVFAKARVHLTAGYRPRVSLMKGDQGRLPLPLFVAVRDKDKKSLDVSDCRSVGSTQDGPLDRVISLFSFSRPFHAHSYPSFVFIPLSKIRPMEAKVLVYSSMPKHRVKIRKTSVLAIYASSINPNFLDDERIK
ncbi:hypothetical protein CONLIGDRAFT_297380 [Coniochaeta ligniaria NRRL 30616]|uniref:Uncharacterized protein n=1 Tax=Coniochaeta ligniaria NRRL 30616 TaxID=1408157 RepID=A0A1J7JNV5_9PEZI|nr:hypothetical protein CONLIGDRAFT_297380 [Coniochaeta ligniaria NRRL 30616]